MQDEDLKEKAKTIKGQVIEALEESINNVDDNMEYDKWHRETCKTVMNLYDGTLNVGLTERFSYGNAQKLVNMTIKYLYMISEIDYEFTDEMRGVFKFIKENELSLHIPIDSFIIDAIWKNTNITLEKYVNTKNIKEDKEYERPSDYIQGWSSWEKNQYYKVEEALSDFLKEKNYSPMEWEMKEWINISKYRNKSSQ